MLRGVCQKLDDLVFGAQHSGNLHRRSIVGTYIDDSNW